MKFTAALLSLVSAASAGVIDPKGLSAASKAGQNLLRKATVVRALEQQDDDSFLAFYDIKYLGCASLLQVNGEGGGDEGILYQQNLVRFALCPSGSCSSSCSGGGEYVVNMMEFVDAYTEAKLNEKEYQCEMIRENCYCDNANDDDVCENQCYTNAGMSECIEYEGQEEFEIQRYLECAEMEENNNNNNGNGNNQYYNGNGNGDNYYGELFIGPYCANDGKSIHLGVFYDQTCTAKAKTSFYASRNYGEALPFSSEPIVNTKECMSCQEVDQDANNNDNNNNGNNNNNNQNYEVSELCAQSYEQAVKCEKGMSISYPDTNGCEYINSILPKLSSVSRNSGSFRVGNNGGKGNAGTVMAWIFGATTILFGAYAYFLYRKIKRGGIQQMTAGGNLA